MEQIEEKRRTVQLLREKERMEDEALTRLYVVIPVFLTSTFKDAFVEFGIYANYKTKSIKNISIHILIILSILNSYQFFKNPASYVYWGARCFPSLVFNVSYTDFKRHLQLNTFDA